jgi:hypothetical protein
MRGPGRLYIDGAVSAFGVHVTYRESALTYLRESSEDTYLLTYFEIRGSAVRGSSSSTRRNRARAGCRGWLITNYLQCRLWPDGGRRILVWAGVA